MAVGNIDIGWETVKMDLLTLEERRQRGDLIAIIRASKGMEKID